MSSKYPGEQFLHEKDPSLHTKWPNKELKRKKHAGQELSQKPADKIADWLNAIEKTHGHKEPKVQERIRNYYHKAYVIKPEEVPESAFLLEQQIARNLGYGTVNINAEFRKKKIDEIINNQKASLDKWLNYLTSEDATYPMWAKYWAFTSMLKMGKFVKEEKENKEENAEKEEKAEKADKKEKKEFGRYKNRTKDTVAEFPALNPRALAMTISVMNLKLEQKQKSKDEREPVKNISVKLDDPSFQQLLSSESFAKLYAQFLIEMPEYSTEGLQETRGKWVKYEQGSDPKPLVDSLDGYPLEWCTANIDTARTQLQGGDFYVYYSINQNGEPIIPRLAIRMQGSNIGEVRGIAHDQNFDPYIGDVAKNKLAEFPDGKAYEKKAEVMNKLTQIEKKVKAKQELDKEDLVFLYELNSPIEGFGYQKDPRIKELLSQRDSIKDAPVVFNCRPEQIAHNQGEINRNTKAFIGELYNSIFEELKNIEHIYTSFPEGKIVQKEITIGGKTAKELAKEIKEKGDKIDGFTEKELMGNKDFKPLKNEEKLDLVILSVKDLGFPNGATIQEIYEKAQELSLKLVPAEVGPQLRLQYEDQPMNDWLLIGSEPLAVSGGLRVFDVRHFGFGNGRWLDSSLGHPDLPCRSDDRWVFARPSSPEATADNGK